MNQTRLEDKESLQICQFVMEGLLEDAKNHELQNLEKDKTMLLELSAVESLLNEVYEASRPNPKDYDDRRDLVRIFNEIARELHGNDEKCPVVKAFGSYLMDLFDPGCDLDLSVILDDTDKNADRLAQIKTLRKFSKKFSKLQRGRHVTNVQLILSARVPVLKVTDCASGVECDLSVGNFDGILKSQIIRMISDIDERFRKLSVLMKLWAKANNINSAKDGTINSYSFILLVAFHLQTRDIPIMPPFSAILKDGLDPSAVIKNIQEFLKYGERNKESLAELFVSLLIKLESVSSLWSSGLCVSTYEGSWILKQLGSISIEDFTDRSQNTCRALKHKKGTVFSCIRDSVDSIRRFTEHKIDSIELKNLLFQAKPRPKGEGVVVNAHKIGKRKRRLERTIQRFEKKLRPTMETCPADIKALVLALAPIHAPSPPPTPVLAPTPPLARVQPPVLPPAQVQAPALPRTQVRAPAPPRAQIRAPAPPRAQVQAPAPPPAQVRAPAPPRAQVRAPAPPRAQVRAPAPPRAQVWTHAPPLAQIRAPAPPLAPVRARTPPRAPAPSLAPVWAQAPPSAAAPFNVNRVGANNVCSTSYGGMHKSHNCLHEAHNKHRFTAQTSQGSGVLKPETSPNHPPGQQMRMPSPPILGHGVFRPDAPRGWPSHQTASSFLPGHPLPAGYRPVRSQADHFGGAQNFPNPARSQADHFGSAQNFLNPARSQADHFGGAHNFPNPVNYPWSPRPSSSFVRPHPPHYPSTPYPFSALPAQVAQHSFPPENRENFGHQSYLPRGNHPHLPPRRFD